MWFFVNIPMQNVSLNPYYCKIICSFYKFKIFSWYNCETRLSFDISVKYCTAKYKHCYVTQSQDSLSCCRTVYDFPLLSNEEDRRMEVEREIGRCNCQCPCWLVGAVRGGTGGDSALRGHSHKAISHQRRGFRRDCEGAELLKRLAAFSLVINFSPCPMFCSSSTRQTPSI